MTGLLERSIKARCPQCEGGALFSGLLSVHESCSECGLPFHGDETADGPSFLVITFFGFLICGLAVWVELAFEPALWLHALLWIPAIIIPSPLLLRLCKAMIIYYHYDLKKAGSL